VANADLAAERAAKVLRLSDVKRLQQLAEQAAALWPAHPRNAERMRGWLSSARDLLGREGLHLAELTRLRGLAGVASDGQGHWTFASAEDQWQHDTLADLTADLERLRDPELGLVHDVEQRLRFAETIEEHSRTGPEARKLWDETHRSIADRAAFPAYAGLQLAPQLGLLPLGPDPQSGLFEFAHLQSGTPARRSPEDGALEITAETGLVFVLLPGGSFRLGQPTGNEGDEPADPAALSVELAPFFVSKYEMTQGQWLRFSGKNPSLYQTFGDDTLDPGTLHPVEQVSWLDCREVLARLALDLPSEAQWEYAARAATQGPWWTGTERESLRGRANIADQSAGALGAQWPAIADWPDLDDGYGVHAPVNAFGPNPFGLYHVVGNVWEWCREPYAPGYGDQLTELYTTRGGSFQSTAALARGSHRNATSPDLRHFGLGVRPVRALDP
jgi:formylglycine-generating enzyme required for sulfatase activity